MVDEFALNDRRGRREHEALSRKPQEQEAKTERRKKRKKERERGGGATHTDDAFELNIRGTTANSRGSRLLFVAPFHRKPNRYARLLTRKSLLCFRGRRVGRKNRTGPSRGAHMTISLSTQARNTQDARNYGHPIISYASRYLLNIYRARLFLRRACVQPRTERRRR